MHTGRSRYKTHAGIPHGSTNNLGSNLALYYQWKENCLVARWDDQSPNGRHAAQRNAAQQASISDDGSLDFEADNANHYDFTDVNIAGSEGFIVFLVINLESNSANSCILGMGTAAHFLEFKGGSDAVRIKLASAATQVDPGDGTLNDWAAGSKFVMALHRKAGDDGDLNIYKNGVLLAQETQVYNNGDGEFNSLGVRSGDRYIDGKIYDVCFIEMGGEAAIVDPLVIERINNYLCAKHGIEIKR